MIDRKSIIRTIWKTPLLRNVLMAVFLGSLILSGYDILTVYPSFERQLISSIERNAINTGRHLLLSLKRDNEVSKGYDRDTFVQDDWNQFKNDANDFGLWKARVFSAKGEIIFSTVDKEAGQINTSDYFKDIVAQGKIFSKLEKKQGTTMEGEVLPLSVFEVYVPVMHQGDFQGAIEVYYDISEELNQIQSLLIWSGAIFISLILLIAIIIVILVIRTAIDSQKLTLAQKELNIQGKIFRDVIDTSQHGIIVTDAEQRIKIINPAFTRLTGYEEDDVTGQTPGILQSGQHDAKFYEQMWRTINEQKSWRGEVWNRCKNGKISPGLLSISIIQDQTGEVRSYVGTFTDITKQKESELHFQNLAHHDVLTELPNRLLFQDRLEQAIRESVRDNEIIALLFIDLDGFKQINDCYGHDAGDALLQEVAHRLTTITRREDTVARLGGDEFVVVLRNMNDTGVIQRIGNKIIEAVNRPVKFENDSLQVGVSIGVSCFPDDGTDSESLLNMADKAMYEAKQSGKNRLVMSCINGKSS